MCVCADLEMRNKPLEVASRRILNYIKLIWECLRSIFSTSRSMKNSSPDMVSDSEQNAHIIEPSESQEEILHRDGNSAMDGGTSLEAIHASLSNFDPEPPSKSLGAGSEGASVDVQLSSDSEDTSGEPDTWPFYVTPDPWPPKDITFPEVMISALTETGKAESSIKVPKQRSYIGRRPVTPSSLADTPCTTLGIQGVLDALNATLRTSYTLDTPSLRSILEDCIEKNYDFGTVYGHLRRIWYTDSWSNIRDKLCRHEKNDRQMRRKALRGNQIVKPSLPPRRVWDLYSNRVVPFWTASGANGLWEWEEPGPISHAWVDEHDRVDVLTPINKKEWPVPIPKEASLNLIRIEMLNLGVQYTWLDVLCLRQKEGLNEDLRMEEWKLDVPTIGQVYKYANVVIYLSGLGLPLQVKEGDFNSERCWFRRAWTLQEVGSKRIIAGDMPDGPLNTKQIDKDGNLRTELLTRFHKQLRDVQLGWMAWAIFGPLKDMQRRVSTNPVDKVAGLTFPLETNTIPTYDESESLEDAWTALVNAMDPLTRVSFLLLYPGVGLGCKKWRPTWKQVMTETLPPDPYCDACIGSLEHENELDVDWFEGFCIEKGHVYGLNVEFTEGVYRYGELVVKSVDGMLHTFAIHATHPILIPEDAYILLGSSKTDEHDDGIWHEDGVYWAVGRHLPGQRFEKVSVIVMDGEKILDRLIDLGIATKSRNILV